MSVALALSLLSLCCLSPVCGAAAAGVTLQQERQSFVRGDKAIVRLQGDPAKGARLKAIHMATRQAVEFGPFDVPGEVAIDTWKLRPGLYELAVTAGEAQAKGELAVRPNALPHVLFGVWGDFPDTDEEGRAYDALGVEHAQVHHMETPDADFLRKLDRGFRYGVHFQPGIWVHFTGKDDKNKVSDDIALLKADGKHWLDPWGVEGICPYRPAAQEAILKRMQELGRAIKGLPYVDAISLEDEWDMAVCYCPACKAKLKKETGLEDIPARTFRPSGTVLPDSDPYLQYLRAIKWPAPGFMYSLANRDIKTVNQDVRIFSIPGVCDGLDIAEMEIYPGLFDDGELFLYGVGPELGDRMLSATRMALSPAKRDRIPCWYLVGWYSPPMLHAPDWVFTLGAESGKMALSNGAAAITVTGMTKMLHKDARFRAMMEDLSRSVRSYGPMFMNTQRAQRNVALLHSDITAAWHGILDPEKLKAAPEQDKWKVVETTWKHAQCHQVAWPAVMRAGIPCESITEDNVLRGELGGFDALIVVNMEYTSEKVKKAIEEYAKAHAVFADESTTVELRGAERLKFDFSRGHKLVLDGKRNCGGYVMNDASEKTVAQNRKLADEIYTNYEDLSREGAKALQQQLPRAVQRGGIVRTGNPEVVATLSEAGQVRYVGLWNMDRLRPQKASVSVDIEAGAVYNASVSRKVDHQVQGGKTTFEATLPPYNGCYYVLSPRAFLAPEIQSAVEGRVVRLGVTVKGEGGQPMGAHPVEVKITDSQGLETPYGGVLGLRDGVGGLEFRLGDNDPVGKWTVVAKNLIDGSAGKAEFQIK